MNIIAMLVGGGVGLASSGSFGLVVGALLGWLLVRLQEQGRDIANLKTALAQQALVAHAQTLVAAPAPGAPAAPAPAAASPPPAPRPMAPPLVTMTAMDPAQWAQEPARIEAAKTAAVWGDTSPALARRRQAATPPTAPPPSPLSDALAPLNRWLAGANAIVKVGVGILFIGLAFLAKFASEHVQVPVELRLASIAGVAVVLMVVGWRLRHRHAAYAQVLQGGAVAVLYLTLFAAFRFYGVLAVAPVFVLMAAVAALAAALAVLQNARALAVIGALGGFATPLLLSTGGGNAAALFGYYLVLDLGIAAVAWHRTWRSLNLIGFVATFGVGSAWGVLKYRPEQYAMSQGFLIAFFLLFIVILLLPARRPLGAGADAGSAANAAHRSDAWVQGSLMFGLPTIVFALQHGLVRHTEYGTAISALLLAGFYVLLARWMYARPRLAVLFEGSLAVGTVFLTLVIPFALDARSTAGAWALEGAGLVWLGFRQSRRGSRAFGYALLLLAGGSMLVAFGRHAAPSGVFNAVLFNALLAAAASLIAALLVRRHADASEAAAEPLLIAWAALWLVATAAWQIDTFVAARFVPAAWLAFSSALALTGTALCVRLDWPKVALLAVGHAPLMLIGVGVNPVVLNSPLQAGGWWAWPLALAMHLVVLARAAPHWPQPVRDATHTGGVLVLAALGALQGRAITADWGDAASAWPWLGWMVAPSLILMLLPRPGSRQGWPITAAPLAYRTVAAALLALAALLWTVIANVASDGSARPLPHLPLLNPLDLGVGVALLATWRWLRSDAAQQAGEATPLFFKRAIALAGFVWLNAMLVRGFHHYGDVPYRFNAWTASLAVHTGITLLWSFTALVLMWLSARRRVRAPWMIGAALLAAVVIKLLLVDLSGAGTVTRIVSFIGVGGLMLVIGFVAPLPAKEQAHAVA